MWDTCKAIFYAGLIASFFFHPFERKFDREVTLPTEPILDLPLVQSSIVEACEPMFMLVLEVTTDDGLMVTFGMVPLLPHGKVGIHVDVVQTSPFGYNTTTTVNHATIVDYTPCDVAREVYLVCTDKRCLVKHVSL